MPPNFPDRIIHCDIYIRSSCKVWLLWYGDIKAKFRVKLNVVMLLNSFLIGQEIFQKCVYNGSTRSEGILNDNQLHNYLRSFPG